MMKWTLIGLMLCFLVGLGQSCTYEEAADIELSAVAGEYIEVEMSEDNEYTECAEATFLYDSTNNSLLVHGHYYDVGQSKWIVLTVTFEPHPVDKTAWLPHVVMDDRASTPWDQIESLKFLKADDKYLVYSICMPDGSDVIQINRRKGVPADDESLQALTKELEIPNSMSKFHTAKNAKSCPNLE